VLLDNLRGLEGRKNELWSLSDEKLYNQVHYVYTDNFKEWKDEIQNLCNLVVDNFNYRYLKHISESLGCFDKRLGSLKLIERILGAKKIDGQLVNEVVSPLIELQLFRTKFSAHLSGSESKKIRKDLISKFGNLRNHYRDLLMRLEKAIKSLIELF
jgi:hypothetical protein